MLIATTEAAARRPPPVLRHAQRCADSGRLRTILCMLFLISRGETCNWATDQMVWHSLTSGFAVYAAKLTVFSGMRKSFRGPSVSSGSDKIYPRMLRRFSSACMSANDGSRLVAYHA